MNRASFLKRLAMAMAASALFEVEWPAAERVGLYDEGDMWADLTDYDGRDAFVVDYMQHMTFERRRAPLVGIAAC